MVTFAWFHAARAQGGEPPTPPTLTLTDAQEYYSLGLHMAILEDPSGELSVEQISSPPFDARFVPSQEETPNYGFTNSVYWVRLSLDNETRRTVDWLLEVDFANMHYVDLYTPLPEGEGFAVKQSGVLRPVSTRDVLNPLIVFNLFVPTQSRQTIYLRFQSGAAMTLALTLWTKEAFLVETQQEHLVHGLFYGMLICLLAYNLFLLFSLWDGIYLYGVFELAATIAFVTTYDGYMEIYVIPNLYYLVQYYYPLSFTLMFISMILFAGAFLEIKTRFPKLHRANLVLLGVWGGLILLTPFTSYHFLTSIAPSWGVVSLIMVLVAGIISWQNGFRPARLFLFAWSGLCVTLTMIILARMGNIPVTPYNENLFRLGMIWLGVCWSLALADRINLLKSEVEGSNQELRSGQRRLSQILEGMPLGVALYGQDYKPRYINQRTIDILSNPERGIRPDLSAGRTLSQTIQHFALKPTGSQADYPIENIPVFSALGGHTASVDDIEIDRGDERVPLEMWASPIRDEAGRVESAVLVFQDITARRRAEAELAEYRKQLELLVEERTAALDASNRDLRLRLEWMSAILTITETMARSSDYTEIYAKIIDIINRLFDIPDSFILELDEDQAELKVLAHSSQNDAQSGLIGSFVTLPEDLLIMQVREKGQLYFISGDELTDIGGPIGEHFRSEKIQSIALVTLHLREQVFGFLGLEMKVGDRIVTQEEFDLLNILSVDIAQLIQDTRLFQQTKALITAEERNRLARELHDSVTQVLFSASLVADLLPDHINDPQAVLRSALELRRLTSNALAEMRTLLLELRPIGITRAPLGDLLTQLTEAVTSRSELQFQLFIDNFPLLSAEIQVTFYRVAQEALNNIVKHAEAQNVIVILSATPPMGAYPLREWIGEIEMTIRDDGVGIIPGAFKTGHLGLGIMRERAAAIGADLKIESQPGNGCKVTLIWKKTLRRQYD